MKIFFKKPKAQDMLDSKQQKVIYIHPITSLFTAVCVLLLSTGIFFYRIEQKIDTINKNVEAMSTATQTWNSFLNGN